MYSIASFCFFGISIILSYYFFVCFALCQTISFAAIVTNAGIICFTMDIFETSDQSKVWLFAGYQYLNFGLTLLFAYLIEDIPEEVSAAFSAWLIHVCARISVGCVWCWVV